MSVKASKQPVLKVVKHRPGIVWLKFGLIVLFVSACSVAAYFYGYQVGGEEVGDEKFKAAVEKVEQKLSDAESENENLQQQLANVTLGAEVDRQSSEKIRQEVIEFKKQLTELKEENSFYRSLMAPTKNKQGLTFGDVEFFESDKPDVVVYSVLVKQLATSHNVLKGFLNFNIIGTQNGAEVSIPLKDVSESVDKEKIKLRFKYFQEIKGKLSLPEGFEALRVELQAQSTGKNAVTIDKQVGWLVQKQR